MTRGTQSDELHVLELVTARLDAAGIAYMLSGSMAMNYYAQPRMTRNIDLVVELDLPQVDALTRLFTPDCYCDAEMIREAVRHQGMFNVIHDDTVVKVDFIVRKDTPYRRSEFARRQRVSVAGVSLWIVPAEDLVLSKLAWAKGTRYAAADRRRSEPRRGRAGSRLDIHAALGGGPLCGRVAVGGVPVSDTPAGVAARYRDLLMRRPAADRLLMGCAMFDTARAFMRAGLGDPTGADRSADMRARLFLRTYGTEFDAVTRARIVAHLRTRA